MENQRQLPNFSAPPASRRVAQTSTCILAALFACLLLFAAVYGVVRWSMGNGQAAVDPPKDDPTSKTFVGWTKPTFVLVISGQTFGYLQPCGCSDPQYGGLARRWELIKLLKDKGWHIVPLDLGDLFPKNSDTPAQQNLLKYETAMHSLHAMGYRAVGLGKQELGVPLVNALAHYSVNNPQPRPVAANLVGAEEKGTYHDLNVRPYEILESKGLPTIGVVGMIGKTVQKAFEGDNPQHPKFASALLTAALGELKQKSQFNVALFQTDEKLQPNVETEVEKCVKWCVEKAPLHVVIHSSDDPEPPSQPQELGGTQLITVGHKGKYVGILGVWDRGGKYEYKYEMVLMGPEFKQSKDNAVAKLMEDYTKRVKSDNMMAMFLRTAHQNQVLLRGKRIEMKYAGSERCAGCHGHADHVWSNSHHAHAFKTLENAKDPSLRQFDGECVQCHTTGFKHDTGFNDPNITERTKKLLFNVGCESCHGPASAHSNDPNDMEIRKLINPWAAHFNKGVPDRVRKQRIANFCHGCHDQDNDVHWDFEKRWADVIHMNPPAKKK